MRGRFNSTDKDVDYGRDVRVSGVVAREIHPLAQQPGGEGIFKGIESAFNVDVLSNDSRFLCILENKNEPLADRSDQLGNHGLHRFRQDLRLSEKSSGN